MRWRTWTIVGAMMTGLACDDKQEPPPESIESRRAAQEAEHAAVRKDAPTTQELLAAPKTPLRLGEMPLTVDVPKGWGLKSTGEGAGLVISLSGPAASGEINIQIGAQINSGSEPFTAARVADVLARAKKDADTKPHALNRVVLRDLGPLKVLEQRMISDKDFTGGRLSPEVYGNTINKNEATGETQTVRTILNPHVLRWNFTVFVPVGEGKYTARSLTFMSLRVSEYERDKEFLEQMMSSLKYDPS